MAGGYVAEMSGQTYTVMAPIVINVTSTIQGPLGIDLGGATILSQITNGAPVIQINAGPGVDLRYLTLSNFTIQGNGREGDGIRIVADGNDRWIYNFSIDNVMVRGVGGYGLDVQGSVFEGLVSDSRMIGNHLGGAYFGHSAGGGQASALHWFGGSLKDNGGAGLFLGNGTRDISVDGVTVANNNGDGISAEWGITSVTDSQVRDNRGAGIWFQNYGYFNSNTFMTSGVQATGLAGYVVGDVVVTGSRSVYTGSDSDTTVLANLRGPGFAYMSDDAGKIITGTALSVGGPGADTVADVTVSNHGMSVASLASITSAMTAAASASSGTGALESALRTALTAGTVGTLSDASFAVTTPIVIYLTGASQGPIGIDLGGAKILSQVAGGRPVIEIVAGPGVHASNLTLSNFSIVGNGREGDGISIVAAGADRSIGFTINNVNIEHVGGIGIDAIGNVSGSVFDSWMHGNLQGGARFANSAGGTADALHWVGGGFRKNGVAGLILDNGAFDMSAQGAYFVENLGAGIHATSGITLVEQSGFENNARAGAWVGGSSTFLADTFSTHGPQTTGIAGSINGGKVVLIGDSNEYYGGGSDPTALINLQGSGTLSIAGSGEVIAGPGISVIGGSVVPATTSPVDTTPDGVAPAPVITGGAIANGHVTLNGTSDPGDQISIYDGMTWLGFATTDSAGAWTFTGNAASDVAHSYGVNGTDLAGNTGTGTINYVPGVTTTPAPVPGPAASPTSTPVAAFTSMDAADGQATLSGTSGAGDQISIYDGMTWLGFATTGSSGTWSFTTNADANVAHTYGINATSPIGIMAKGTGLGLLGHSGLDTLTGGAGNDVIVGGPGSDTLTGGSGTDHMWGDGRIANGVLASPDASTGTVMTGADTFIFAPGNGNDDINDFRQSDHDKIDVRAYGFHSIADMVITDTGADTKIAFDATNGATLVGLGDPNLLHASDFIFA